MGFSISLDDMARALVERRGVKREKIADYLEAIASDARQLADIWLEPRQSVITERAASPPDRVHSPSGSLTRREQFYASLPRSWGAGQIPNSTADSTTA